MDDDQPVIAVLGAGSWGTVLAHILAKSGKTVRLWCRSATVAAEINSRHKNAAYLAELALAPALQASDDLASVVAEAALVVVAVPTSAVRAVSRAAAAFVKNADAVVCAAKGFEGDSGLRMSEVLAQELPPRSRNRIAALSGPNLSMEIAQGQPATSVVACDDIDVARASVVLLTCPTFRLYSNSDLIGVEYGGALKNIVAIGAGIVDGLGFGHNAKAAMVTRGLAEMTRLGVAAGAHPLTFAGLSGLGDLIATCGSTASRNHYVGTQLALGRPWPAIAKTMHAVAEGVNTTRAARLLCARYDVQMPIAAQTHAVLFEGRDVRAAMRLLLERSPRDEIDELSGWSGPPG